MKLLFDYRKIWAVVIAALLFILAFYCTYKKGYNSGYDKGFVAGEAKAVAAYCQAKANASDNQKESDKVAIGSSVITHTEVAIKPKQKQEDADVKIETKPPKVSVLVNDKKYDFNAKSEYLQAGVQTTAAVAIKIPERRWTVGLGTDGKKAAYMLKAPIKGAVGVWVAGSGKDKIMGGLSVSF